MSARPRNDRPGDHGPRRSDGAALSRTLFRLARRQTRAADAATAAAELEAAARAVEGTLPASWRAAIERVAGALGTPVDPELTRAWARVHRHTGSVR